MEQANKIETANEIEAGFAPANVLNPYPPGEAPLRADTTLHTADQTELTADKV
jgi:hypothetical protein